MGFSQSHVLASVQPVYFVCPKYTFPVIKMLNTYKGSFLKTPQKKLDLAGDPTNCVMLRFCYMKPLTLLTKEGRIEVLSVMNWKFYKLFFLATMNDAYFIKRITFPSVSLNARLTFTAQFVSHWPFGQKGISKHFWHRVTNGHLEAYWAFSDKG